MAEQPHVQDIQIGRVAEEALRALGPGWRRTVAIPRVALHAHGPGGAIALDAQVVKGDVLGRLAMSVLHLRRYAPVDTVPVVALRVAAVTDRLVDRVAGYLREVAPDVGFVLLDDGGSVRLAVPALRLSGHIDGAPRVPRSRAGPALFTDLNRWMLKFLLHRGCPAAWFGRSTQRVPDATRLAAATGVSVAKAHQFVTRAVEMDLVTRHPVRLRDARRLLDLWLQHDRIEAQVRVPIQWALGGRGDLAPLRAYTGRWALGGLAACDVLGLRHVEVTAPALVHVEDPAVVTRACDGVEVDDERDAHVVLVVARYPESIFRARVPFSEGWHVDLWQAALDVANVRGGEQSDYLSERLLAARRDD